MKSRLIEAIALAVFMAVLCEVVKPGAFLFAMMITMALLSDWITNGTVKAKKDLTDEEEMKSQ